MSRDALEQLIRSLARDHRAWVELGVIDSIEQDPDVGLMLECSIVPGGDTIHARPRWSSGGRTGEGLWHRAEVGDEVMLLLPGGDRNRAVALFGPLSGPAKPPDGWTADSLQLVDRDGLEVRTEAGTDVEPVVLATLLPSLKSSLTEMRAALLGLGVASLPETDSLLAAIDTAFRGVVRAEEA